MPKRTSKRFSQLPENFLKYLRRNLAGFKQETKKTQLAVTEMILSAPSKFRVHSEVDGAARFGWQELERKFGRKGFDAVNGRLGLFHVEKDDIGRDQWSYAKGTTKAYISTDKVSDLREKWLQRACYRTTKLLTEDGDVIRAVPKQAIDAKRVTSTGIEVTREGWRGEPVEPAVPINDQKLKLLALHLQQIQYAQEVGAFQGSLFHQEPDRKYLKDLKSTIYQCRSLANNTVKKGHIIHRYKQSQSGRLYAEGFNLQNAPKPVRQAALHGLYDYDIENCHYAILAQMAQQHGYTCTAIGNYLANKKQIRAQLAGEFDISVGQVKQGLIALVYGAYFSERPKDALPRILGGSELARRFYEAPLFLGLRDDIRGARSAILQDQTVSRQTIQNLRGLNISLVDEDGNKRPDRQLMAHLLQGVEALALESAHKLYPDSILLLQHDGWTSSKELDTKALEEAIFAGTGYRLEVVGERITCKVDDALAEHPDEGINPNQYLTHFPLKTAILETRFAS